MSYEGYRVKIGNTIIPNMLIASGTYNFLKEKRLVRSWIDAKGIEHYDYFDKRKVVIEFSIRERNLEEHKTIKDVLKSQDKLNVLYWDDYECVYRTGTFKMTEPYISHRKALNGDILYNPTKIELKEY
jgi:hypothetical protein